MEKVALTGKTYAAINQEKGRENAGFVVTEKGVVVIDTTKLLTNAEQSFFDNAFCLTSAEASD